MSMNEIKKPLSFDKGFSTEDGSTTLCIMQS